MEKLIELLNEYEKKRIEKINSEWKLFVKLQFKPYTEESLTNKAYRRCWLEICSKYYGFIKWLVENDKIDTEKVIDTAKSSVIDTYYYEEGIDDIYIPLLMVLAIQDEPIEYLLSVIK